MSPIFPSRLTTKRVPTLMGPSFTISSESVRTVSVIRPGLSFLVGFVGLFTMDSCQHLALLLDPYSTCISIILPQSAQSIWQVSNTIMTVFKCMDAQILKYTLIQYCVHSWHWKTYLNPKPSTMLLLSMAKPIVSEICSSEIPGERQPHQGRCRCETVSLRVSLKCPMVQQCTELVKGTNLTPGPTLGPCQIWVLMEQRLWNYLLSDQCLIVADILWLSVLLISVNLGINVRWKLKRDTGTSLEKNLFQDTKRGKMEPLLPSRSIR